MTETTHHDDVWRSGPPPIDNYPDNALLEVKFPTGTIAVRTAYAIRHSLAPMVWRPIPGRDDTNAANPSKALDAWRYAGQILGHLVRRYADRPVSIGMQTTAEPSTLVYRIGYWSSDHGSVTSRYYLTLDMIEQAISVVEIADAIAELWDLGLEQRPPSAE